ncbi:MAG: Flp pilus assembly protein CpaB [Thermodesulfobacteriota bacterium]
MTNLKAFIPILLSILIAIGGSYFLYNWVKGKAVPKGEVVVKESKAIPVVVAKVPVKWGVRITAEMVETKPYFENSLPQGYFSKVSDITNRVVTTPLLTGEPVLEHRLAATSMKTGGMSAILKSGKRAISVKGNNVMGIAGFINPGNRIDVLLTIKDPKGKKEVTKTVLEDLYVLAAGRQIQENSEGAAAPVDVYTLEVTLEQGERLTLASNKGRLQFALRGSMDSDVVLTKGITVPELLDAYVLNGSKPAAVKKAKVKSGTVSKRYYKRPREKTNVTIEMIKGLSISKKKFKQ